jgi:MscS family membrane protein
MFSTSAITNHSRRPIRRINMTIGVTYESKAKQVRELLEELRRLVASHPGLDRGFHFVHFTEFADSSLNIQIYCFTASTVWTEHLAVREELMLAVMDVVESKGLEMAFPTRTVYLRDEQWGARAQSA